MHAYARTPSPRCVCFHSEATLRVRPAFVAAALTFDAMALAVAEVLGDVEADIAADATASSTGSGNDIGGDRGGDGGAAGDALRLSASGRKALAGLRGGSGGGGAGGGGAGGGGGGPSALQRLLGFDMAALGSSAVTRARNASPFAHHVLTIGYTVLGRCYSSLCSVV